LPKRLLCVFLILLFLPGASAFAAEAAGFGIAGYDGEDTYRSWDKCLFFTRMAERTGVELTFDQYTDLGKWTAAKAAMTPGGSLPDVLFKAELTPAECIALRGKGVLIDLKPLLEENCPNLWAILSAHPDYLAAITLPDGSIAALPFINAAPLQNCLWVNTEWLDTLGLPMPGTAEELANVLAAFKNGDPNGNGRRDEVPLMFLGAFDLKFLAQGFGMIANDYNLYARDGKACFMPLDARFRPFITWCRDLYVRGLIAHDGFVTGDSQRAVTDNKATPVAGMLLNVMVSNLLPSAWTLQYAVVPPLAYGGTAIYRSFAGNVLDGAFAITSACASPALALKWVDTLYTEAGARLASVGLENTDYLVDGDGTWRLAETVSDNRYFTGETLISSGGTPPGISCDAFQRKYTDGTVAYVSGQMDIVNAVAARPFPYYSLSYAEEAEIAPLQAAIGLYVDESIARWVIGETAITDESFAEFQNNLSAMGLEQFMTFWQGVLDAGAGGAK
jgi:putative aldouronate transport system substrate-binding protein